MEDDMEGEDEPEHGGCTEARPRSQSPFSHFRARAAYLRKSVSADDHLDMGLDYSSGTAVEGKPTRGKGKLKRKFVSLMNHLHFFIENLHKFAGLLFTHFRLTEEIHSDTHSHIQAHKHT